MEARHPTWLYVVLALCAVLLAASVAYRQVSDRDQWQLRGATVFNPRTGVLCRRLTYSPDNPSAKLFPKAECTNLRTGAQVDARGNPLPTLKERIAHVIRVRRAKQIGAAVLALCAVLLVGSGAYRLVRYRRVTQAKGPSENVVASEGSKDFSRPSGFRKRMEKMPRLGTSGTFAAAPDMGSEARAAAPDPGLKGVAETRAAAPHPRLEGVEGWLAWFAFGATVGIGECLYAIFVLAATYGKAATRGAVTSPSTSLSLAIFAIGLWVVAAAEGLFLMRTKNSETRRFWVIVLAVELFIWIAVQASKSAGSDTSWLSMIVYMLLSLIYWLRSKRVTCTYGALELLHQERWWREPATADHLNGVSRHAGVAGVKQYSSWVFWVPPALGCLAATIAIISGWMWGTRH